MENQWHMIAWYRSTKLPVKLLHPGAELKTPAVEHIPAWPHPSQITQRVCTFAPKYYFKINTVQYKVGRSCFPL